MIDKSKVKSIAIGNFDGIHLAHKEVLKYLDETGIMIIITKTRGNLTPLYDRENYTTKKCFFYDFFEIRDLSGEEFIKLLTKDFVNLEKIVIGYDFYFGKNRAYNAHDIKKYFNGEVIIVKEFCFKNQSVHSEEIRSFLRRAMIKQANTFLGREYCIKGEVIKGQGIGQKSLYPTLNLDVKMYFLPKDGVYATKVKYDENTYDGVCFIGKKLSLNDEFSIEVYVIDKIINEKINNLAVYFVEFLRENKKFDNLNDLKNQISHDIKTAKEKLSSCKMNLNCLLSVEKCHER